ncbi:MAG: KEOPS complex subunit Cgi121 [Thaumarchaeota archaeon]|nr:KEOPS complex subunit Cgi121 [Nitrososphaerota archaeon]
MIQVKFVGGAKKLFQSESLTVNESCITLEQLLSILLRDKPVTTPDLDIKNILVAVNGVDSSALNGMSTILNDNDAVSIIPIIHGGSQNALWFTIQKRHILAVEIRGKKSYGVHVLESLRRDYTNIKFQTVSSKFVLNPYHLRKILLLSINSEKHNMLLSNKLETDILMRFAVSGQISEAIKTAGITPGQDFVLVAMGTRKNLNKFFKTLPYDRTSMFAKKQNQFLKKHFHLTQRQMGVVRSEEPLADMLVEKAATLL